MNGNYAAAYAELQQYKRAVRKTFLKAAAAPRPTQGVHPMTGDELAFLDAILANPADDTVRLVYADWLEENGQAERAEFIRVQIATVSRWAGCNYSNHDTCHDRRAGRGDVRLTGCVRCRRRAQLLDRADELANGPGVARVVEWFGRGWSGYRQFRPEYTRGFVSAVTCGAADWLDHAKDILGAHPVTAVRLTTVTPGDIMEVLRRLEPREPWPATLTDYLATLWPYIAFEVPDTAIATSVTYPADWMPDTPE